MIKQSFVSRVRAFLAVSVISGVFLISGCGSDSSSGPATYDATGVYTQSSATINGVDVSDVTAIIYNNRIMMFSPTAEVMYDGTIDSVADGNLSATVDVYYQGQLVYSDQPVTGLVATHSQITGELTGELQANASFTLTYNTLSTRAATLPRIVTDGVQPVWQGYWLYPASGMLTKLDFLSNQSLYIRIGSDPVTPDCVSENGVFAVASTMNVYTLNTDIIEQGGCGIGDGATYTGLASVIDSNPQNPGTNDVLIFALSNGTYNLFGAYYKQEYFD